MIVSNYNLQYTIASKWLRNWLEGFSWNLIEIHVNYQVWLLQNPPTWDNEVNIKCIFWTDIATAQISSHSGSLLSGRAWRFIPISIMWLTLNGQTALIPCNWKLSKVNLKYVKGGPYTGCLNQSVSSIFAKIVLTANSAYLLKNISKLLIKNEITNFF